MGKGPCGWGRWGGEDKILPKSRILRSTGRHQECVLIFSTQQAGLLTPFVKKQRSGDPGTKTGSGKEFRRPRVGGHCPRAFSSIQAAFYASASRCCF